MRPVFRISFTILMRENLEIASLVCGFAINQDRGIDDSSSDDS